MNKNATNNSQLSSVLGHALLQLARRSIAARFGPDRAPELSPEALEALEDPKAFEKRGTFVTLHKRAALRGCIGCLTGQEAIVESVKKNAVNAAFRDPRFPPLKEEELSEVAIELSILSEPEELSLSGADEIIDVLDRSKPGVILKKGANQATFLPQVWSQLPRAEEFLDNLSLKAGLPPTAWREGSADILTYEVQSFEEG